MAIFFAMIYLGLWRFHSWHKFSHAGSITFIIATFIKATGLCVASIALRMGWNWDRWSWALLNGPDHLSIIAFMFVYCSWANFSLKNVAHVINRFSDITVTVAVFLGLSGIFVSGSEIYSGNLIYRDVDAWLSLVRDIAMGIIFLTLLAKVRTVKNVKLCSREKNTERSLHHLAIVAAISIIMRGLTVAAYHWSFSPEKNTDPGVECSISHLLCVIVQQLGCNTVPMICLAVMQGLVGKVAEYEMIQGA